MIETKTIEVQVYRDPVGKPTCASNWKLKQVCQWVGLKNFGTEEICVISDEKIERDDGGRGWMRPVKDCPIWRG